MQPVGQYIQRSMVQTIIRLANKYEGGSWQLVEVIENLDESVLTFELDRGMVDMKQMVQKVRVIIEPVVVNRK